MTKREARAAITAADKLCRIVADEHADRTGHTVETFPGVGWGCTVCDPDLFDGSK